MSFTIKNNSSTKSLLGAAMQSMTVQQSAIPGRERDMEKNYAGGFGFTVTDKVALERLLMLGTAKGSYHASGTQLTKDQLGRLMTVLARGHDHPQGGIWVVDLVRSVLRDGRCCKRVYAMMILATVILHGDPKTVKYCRQHLREMISIPTDLFSFIGFVDKWGRGQKRAVADWFRLQADGSPRSGRSLAYLAFKYFQRDGWSVKDLLRLCHLKPSDCSLAQQIVLKCVVKGWDDTVVFVKESAESSKPDDMEDGKVSASLQEKLAGLAIDADLVSALHVYDSLNTDEARDVIETVRFLAGVSTAKMLGNSVEATALAVRLISKLGIPREMLPTHMLNSREIWDALLVRDSGEEARLCMPATAMVRNLPKMTIVGSLGDKVANGLVCDALSSTGYLRKARIHPIQMVAAKMTYGSGHGLRGSLSWSPISTINAALERGIHASFENVEPTGASIYAGVDVSPSMSSFVVEGLEMMKARDAAAIMALVFKKTETNVDVGMFSSGGGYGYGRSSDISKVDGIVPCDLKASDTIAQAMRKLSLGPWGGTDCSLPIRKALKEKKVYDVFIILTDNDTWAGPEHASESLKRYRKAVNPRAKLVVIAFAACTYSIADPLDAGMMDMTGFDPSSPRILRDFILQGMEDQDDAAGAGAEGKY